MFPCAANTGTKPSAHEFTEARRIMEWLRLEATSRMGYFQVAFENLQGGRHQNLPGQPVPVVILVGKFTLNFLNMVIKLSAILTPVYCY